MVGPGIPSLLVVTSGHYGGHHARDAQLSPWVPCGCLSKLRMRFDSVVRSNSEAVAHAGSVTRPNRNMRLVNRRALNVPRTLANLRVQAAIMASNESAIEASPPRAADVDDCSEANRACVHSQTGWLSAASRGGAIHAGHSHPI